MKYIDFCHINESFKEHILQHNTRRTIIDFHNYDHDADIAVKLKKVL